MFFPPGRLIPVESKTVVRLIPGLYYRMQLMIQLVLQLRCNSTTPQFEPDRNRSVFTNRLTYRTARDELTFSLFTFYSPTDNDYYLRPSVSFRQSDHWTFTGGANLFSGKRSQTFFGQLEDNSNVWFRARYNF